MFGKLFDPTYKEFKKCSKVAEAVVALEDEYKKLTDEELKAKTPEFKKRLEKGETLDDIMVEAFATAREAASRVLGLTPFKVQIIGAAAMHFGNIAEMKTGEGKTLTSVLVAYLNALPGKGVHIVTVNEYLASRDATEMGEVHKFLGLTVGLNLRELDSEQKREQYYCDITYSTNSELGFDYLRDHMVLYKEQMVQRPEMNFAIVDEVDSILIDEARTPLIISGGEKKGPNLYVQANSFAKCLHQEDYEIDVKDRHVALTESGMSKAEKYFNVDNLYDVKNVTIVHHINNALRANYIMEKDKDYVVHEGAIVIVDPFTGRLMVGRQWSDGLHQAIEAKENVQIKKETRTLATITYQNYFRMYKKLAGMTGTAKTEEEEFRNIYNMFVVEIPTNVPVIRIDEPDLIFRSMKAKYLAIAKDIKERHEKGQPVLVGTVSIENSEKLSNILKREGIKHEVLNAKYHEKEAEIIAQAGKYGAVTIATNMAGRGTDIMLGGNSEFLAKQEMRKQGYSDELIEQANAHNETEDEEILKARETFNKYQNKFEEEIKEEKEKVLAAGGLKIIGTERHESRRIDNQLRGRSGRQGDPGESRFYIALDDDLMKIFGGDMITSVYNTLKADENMPIEMGLLSKTVENAQKRVEGQHFSIRKHVLQYDDVMNTQREIIYSQRREVLDGKDLKEKIQKMMHSVIEEIILTHETEEGLDKEGVKTEVKAILDIELNDVNDNTQELIEELYNKVIENYTAKEKEIGEQTLRELERVVMLKVVDQKWMDHIDAMDELKDGIGLRAYGQKDPVALYKLEGFDMFEQMTNDIKIDVVKILTHLQGPQKVERKQTVKITGEGLKQDRETAVPNKSQNAPNTPVKNEGPQVGRNDQCPCRKPERSIRIAVENNCN